MTKGKVFGDKAARVTTAEMTAVVAELQRKVGRLFQRFEATRPLATKETHGDIDILVVTQDGVTQALEMLPVVESFRNGTTTSCLYPSEAIGKQVHVDFIRSGTLLQHETKRVYYAYNDLSCLVGIVAKKMNWKYGSEGFRKRFRDLRGIWHDIPVTDDLLLGLQLLGYDHRKFDTITSHDDIVEFVASSPFFDSRQFAFADLTSADRNSFDRRDGVVACANKLVALNRHASLTDCDFFLIALRPCLFGFVECVKAHLNAKTYAKSSKYDGKWVMDKCSLKPGPVVGKLLKAMSDKFGTTIDQVPEDEMATFVQACQMG